MRAELLSQCHTAGEWRINSHADVLRLRVESATRLPPYCETLTGEPMVVMTETTFPFRTEIPSGEVVMTSEGDVSQLGELWMM